MVETLYFGGVDLTRYVKGITVSRPAAPSQTVDELTVPGRPGTVFKAASADAQEIKISAYIKGETVSEVTENRHGLAGALAGMGEKKLILPDDPGRYFYAAFVSSSEVVRSYHSPAITLTFHMSQPYSYSEERRTQALGTGSNTVPISGNVETYPSEIVLTASGSTASISDGTHYLDFEGLSSGQNIIIKPAEDYASRMPTLDSDFFAVGPGATTLTLTGCTGQIVWYDTWA